MIPLKAERSRVRAVAVLPAAGQGTRLKSRVPKPLVPIAGLPLLVFTLKRMVKSFRFEQVLVPTDPALVERMRHLIAKHGLRGVEVLAGGAMRADSVRNAVEAIRPGIADGAVVAIHDIARPFFDAALVRESIVAAHKSGAAILAEKAKATVKFSDARGLVAEKTIDRNRVYLAQTPQCFRLGVLKKAYAKVGARYSGFTDEAALVEAAGSRVRLVASPGSNFKITTPEDLDLAEAYWKLCA